MERRATPPRWATSPAWGPPPPCKQSLENKVTCVKNRNNELNHRVERNPAPKRYEITESSKASRYYYWETTVNRVAWGLFARSNWSECFSAVSQLAYILISLSRTWWARITLWLAFVRLAYGLGEQWGGGGGEWWSRGKQSIVFLSWKFCGKTSFEQLHQWGSIPIGFCCFLKLMNRVSIYIVTCD